MKRLLAAVEKLEEAAASLSQASKRLERSEGMPPRRPKLMVVKGDADDA